MPPPDSHLLELVRAFAISPTFWRMLAVFGGGLLASGLVALVLSRHLLGRMRWRRLHPATSGAAAAVDFALTIPVFLTVVTLVVQFCALMNDALVVHYAAFAAARTARVWVVEEQISEFSVSSVAETLGIDVSLPVVTDKVEQMADRAARFALIPASPAGRVPSPQAGRRVPDATLHAIARTAGLSDRGAVFVRKARWAFDRRNADVEVAIVELARVAGVVSDVASVLGYDNPLAGADGWPVTGTVTFQAEAGILWGRLLGRRRSDGVWVTDITAEMTVL